MGRLQPQAPPSQHATQLTYPNAASSMSTFSVAQSPTSHLGVGGHSQTTQGSSAGYMASDSNNTNNNFAVVHGGQNQNSTTPVYLPEITYAAGAGAIQFGDSNMLGLDGNAVGEEEMLATMQALKNPAWWQNMMMPG